MISTDTLLRARAALRHIRLEPPIRACVVRLIRATRQPDRIDPDLARLVRYGASPRASIALAEGARAFLNARAFTTPDDVKDIAHDVLRHRIIVTYEAEAEGVEPDDIVNRMLDGVPVR